jgi:hypothetical protein
MKKLWKSKEPKVIREDRLDYLLTREFRLSPLEYPLNKILPPIGMCRLSLIRGQYNDEMIIYTLTV